MLVRLEIQTPTLRILTRAGTIVAIALLVLFGIGPDVARAQSVPTVMAHQGRLLNASNAPITTTVSVNFAIYDAATAGSNVWNETKAITPDTLGFYETMLGSVMPLPTNLPNPAYLQITVAGEPLLPRMQVGSVPFAQHAGDGVPSGYSILGGTVTAPSGYSFAGVMAGMDSWTTKASTPTPRELHAVGVVNNVLYAVGGYNGSVQVSTVEAYDPTTNSWTTKASMPTARKGLAAGVVNNVLYAVGGNNGSVPVSTVEAYDPTTNSWTTKASLPTARQDLAAGVVNSILYAVGGLNGSVPVSTVEAYDPTTNSWTTKATLPTARRYLAAGVVNSVLYAVGGWNGSVPMSTVEAYDPTTNSWTTKASLPTARYTLAAGVIYNVLYAIGGIGSSGGTLSTLEAYAAPLYQFIKN